MFVLNGFETVEALNSLDEGALDYLGIVDENQRVKILQAVGSLFVEPDFQFLRGVERDSGCFMSDKQTSQGDQENRSQLLGPSSSESGVSEEEFHDRSGQNIEEPYCQYQERGGRGGRSRSHRTQHVTNATIMMQGFSS